MEIKFKRYELATGEFTTATIEPNHNVVDCLFTGIQDNNGVDAYAGDTVKTPTYTGTIEYATDICCWIVRRPDTTFVRLEVVRLRGFEITGNDGEVLKFVDWISPYIVGRKKKQYLGFWKREERNEEINIYINR